MSELSTVRNGRFTSSEIWRLLEASKDGKFGARGLTYIDEKVAERDMCRTIKSEFYSQPTAWGQIMEHFAYAHAEVSTTYSIISKGTLTHADYPYWVGTPDLWEEILRRKEAEIKCYYPVKHHKYSRCLMKQDIALLRKEFPMEYWQMGSNASILGCDVVEAIAFMPYEKHLEHIRNTINNEDFFTNVMGYKIEDWWKYRFIVEKPLKQLPCLPIESKIPDLVKFEFEFPKSDKQLLENYVISAESRLQSLIIK